MNEIKYVCSLGPFCQAANILKSSQLKKCSYPFDWIYFNYNDIIHCLEDDFNIFLDKTYYVSIHHYKCGHSRYHPEMFNHGNPLNHEWYYHYIIRCVNRFKQLIQYEDYKLFLIFLTNTGPIEEYLKNDIIAFNRTFSTHVKNYKLLVICNIVDKQENYHKFTYHDNIDFLELHTLHRSNGISFGGNSDDAYLNNVLHTTYHFNVDPEPHKK
jgi:hypothetical protein